MSKKELFRAAVADTLELPEDVVVGLPRVIITGRDSLFLENPGSITDFSGSRLKLKYSGGFLEIKGRDLAMPLLRRDALTVEGEISSLTFTDAGE